MSAGNNATPDASSTAKATTGAAFEVTRQTGGVAVTNSEFFAETDDSWVARALDGERLVLAKSRAQDDMKVGGSAQGLLQCSPDMLLDFLMGLHRRRWSGAVAVDTQNGVKKIYFGGGEVVFAGSNMMDDRLGEVIYREALITLDELTNSAAQVDRKTKFGQVLLASKIFTNSALYRALQSQVRQILRSVFMVPKVYVEINAGTGLAPTEVVFDEGTASILDESYCYGCVFREFLGRLREDTRVELTSQAKVAAGEQGVGTFRGDLLELVSSQGTIAGILETSKLIDLNTIAALADMVYDGLCALPNIAASERQGLGPELSPLKAKIDAFYVLCNKVKKAFSEAGKSFPLDEVRVFVRSLNPKGFTSVFLDTDGELARDSVTVMFAQCRASPGRVQYFAVRIESLNQFLLQVAGDLLAFNIAKEIRTEYRAMVV